ncbi:MAG TPA: class I SAM-dependent RNA methyltransferase [Bryobacteraceae bacterium]|nr:class I SAM-dependent RNA methyltransferase [Bryobacteraceae bacterium]
MGETSIVNDVFIDKWVYGGEALARLDTGRVVFAPFVLPGETVRLNIGENVHADLIEVVSPSPERIAPVCPVFARCGGCHYQHASYGFQLARKAEILREQLRRVGKIEYSGQVEIISGPAFGYRNRAQFHVENGRIGYLAPRSHTLVPVTGDCPVASPKLNEALAAMRERVRDPQFPRFVRSIELFTNETGVQVNIVESDKRVARWFFEWCNSADAIEYETGVGTFRVGPRSFFQVNRFLIDNLVEAALGPASSDDSGSSALDLYAGVGLFALPLAKHFGEVIAVEANSGAARDLEFNAARARVAVRTEHGRVEDFLASEHHNPGEFDFILADPPRAGLGKVVAGHLARLAPPRITIVSCDPATLARDVATLKDYEIEKLILVDLFPQTYHLETVAHLRRRAK